MKKTSASRTFSTGHPPSSRQIEHSPAGSADSHAELVPRPWAGLERHCLIRSPAPLQEAAAVIAPILETRKLRQYSLPQIIQPRMGPTSTGPQSLNGASVTSHDLSLSEWRPHDFLSICDKKPGQQGRDVPDGHVRTIHVVRSQKPAGGSPRPVWVTLN